MMDALYFVNSIPTIVKGAGKGQIKYHQSHYVLDMGHISPTVSIPYSIKIRFKHIVCSHPNCSKMALANLQKAAVLSCEKFVEIILMKMN